MKPFLKWPGGKYRQVDRICSQLDKGKRLVEPFVGSAAVFLNSDFGSYLLADSNPDLINLYKQLQEEGEAFIQYCKSFFNTKNNSRSSFYEFRNTFNQSDDIRLKSALFLYMNRHGYNGLCRYNSKGKFNVPFGRYALPYFPEKEMRYFYKKSGKAKFIHDRFDNTLKKVTKGDIVYCDPPYAPLSDTAYFTDYSTGGFRWEHQIELAKWAGKLSGQGIKVVISNHDIKTITDLYRDTGAGIDQFEVRRTISCQANNRVKVGEIMAVFQP